MDPLQRYFAAEKHGAMWLIAFAVVALAVTVWLWRSHSAFRAMAIPLALIGLAQLGIGVGLFARTDKQVATLRADLAAQPQPARDKELARMERVNRAFTLIEMGEAALIVVGLALALGMRSRPAIMGVGMALLLQAAIMLVFDLFAEHRARVYTEWLRGEVAGGS